MKQSESIAKLAAALVAANREIRPIAKDSVNPHFKSKFASLDAIMCEIRPILASHGLAIIQGATTPHTNESGTVTAFTVETLLVHESGEWVLSSVVMPIIKSDPQGAGAAVTYGRRYGVSALLGLSTDEDDDGNAATLQGQKSAAKRASARTAGTGTSPTQAPAAQSSAPLNQRTHLPFGKSKGTPLKDMRPEDLLAAVTWARENKPQQYAEFIEAADMVLDEKTASV